MWPLSPTHPSIVSTPTCAPIHCNFRDLLSSFLSVGYFTVSFSSIDTFFKSSIFRILFFSATHPTTRHKLSAFFSCRKGNFIFTQIFLSTTLVHCLVIKVKFQPFIFSIVRCVHDPISLFKERQGTHDSPIFDIRFSTRCLYFCIS